ncbi:molybdenum cofactor biosynthesis protein MoaE [Desulfovibrio inopinatus]|uniref:molybdenum cofactor biosynthesis protein MoaE n=1 Tax=Desulfovibrio inopinatus TaxID=102109 RepID=UPI000429D3AD|nr:molybdenum cofactor biosynthesis protein MoaE [Desulfovibrio inopinatus]
MDISKTIAELKKEPGFAENVGMVLVHNGVVRGTTRNKDKTVSRLKVTPDHDKIEALCQEFSKKPGIFKVIAKAHEGIFEPGDDLLFIIVAGDIRENVSTVLMDALNTIKKEAVSKVEYTD